MLRAAGEPSRLRLLERLMGREVCVSELAASSGELMSTISQRLRLLRTEGLVRRRRDGRHMYYSLTDHHVVDLVKTVLEHAAEDG
ncbi:MAG: metalloregulator ArsR/SmtB family transcription factor [Deltaproteobacteria bacterium]|nr:metalloregulator ArsR/SmtB family transcription factor [Deltaproteobacteria bacterium]